jgi:phosphatidate cytidylyltransferase
MSGTTGSPEPTESVSGAAEPDGESVDPARESAATATDEPGAIADQPGSAEEPGPTAEEPGSTDNGALPAGGVEEPRKSRAGRNLPAAFVVGVLLGAIALASLYWRIELFVLVVIAALVIGTDELTSAMRSKGIRLTKFPLLVAAVLMPTLGFFSGTAQVLMGMGLMFLFIIVWRLLRLGVHGFVRDATASGFVLSYAPLMGAFAALIAASPDGADRVVTFVVLSVASDIGGYAAGVLFGKHPMAPRISPKKSWEGFAGSVALQVLLGAVLFVTLLESDWWKGALVGAAMTVTATLGDFAESAVKRDLGLKDMSNLLPGHGGLMDRLDSIIPNTVVAYTLFALTLGL